MIPLRIDTEITTRPVVTYGALSLCALVFVGVEVTTLDRAALYRAVAASPAILFAPTTPVLERVGRLLASLLLHDGWRHLIWNCIFLGVFGPPAEQAMGRLRYAALLSLAGPLAMLTHAAWIPDAVGPMVGLSGSLAAVTGAVLVLSPRATVQVLIPAGLASRLHAFPVAWVTGLLGVGQVLGAVWAGGARAGGVAYAAHLAGFLLGAGVGWILRRAQRRPAIAGAAPYAMG